jgi:hypothetical protein
MLGLVLRVLAPVLVLVPVLVPVPVPAVWLGRDWRPAWEVPPVVLLVGDWSNPGPWWVGGGPFVWGEGTLGSTHETNGFSGDWRGGKKKERKKRGIEASQH